MGAMVAWVILSAPRASIESLEAKILRRVWSTENVCKGVAWRKWSLFDSE